jgi:alkylation response protein AidB-like acyl-CoA dehydrogenase
MVLTEEGAGSDVGAGRTKAKHIAGDEWHLEGTKRFITGGDNDYFREHRPLGAGSARGRRAGNQGAVAVPGAQVLGRKDGTMGERNGVRCTKVEHKMGLRASATCELTFGDDQPARGLLLGNVHNGIRQMFNVIEQARMAIGVKSMSTLSTAYLNALAFAQELRVQGGDLLRIMEKTSPRVNIIQHPDVRRMLMAQKCHAEGMRALIFFAASLQDQVRSWVGTARRSQGGAAVRATKRPAAAAHQRLLLREGLRAFGGVAAVLRRLGLPARTIRLSSTSATRRSTRCTRARRTFRRWTCCCARFGRDGGETLRELLAQAKRRSRKPRAERRCPDARGAPRGARATCRRC